MEGPYEGGGGVGGADEVESHQGCGGEVEGGVLIIITKLKYSKSFRRDSSWNRARSSTFYVSSVFNRYREFNFGNRTGKRASD